MAKASGIHLSSKEAEVVLGMVDRGDRKHDIAAWFGVNQGRIAEVEGGSHGNLTMAPLNQLPPKGPPGIKGRRLHAAVSKAIDILSKNGDSGASEVADLLQSAKDKFDTNEK